TKPIETTKPIDPTKLNDPTTPTKPTETTKPIETTETTKPIETINESIIDDSFQEMNTSPSNESNFDSMKSVTSFWWGKNSARSESSKSQSWTGELNTSRSLLSNLQLRDISTYLKQFSIMDKPIQQKKKQNKQREQVFSFYLNDEKRPTKVRTIWIPTITEKKRPNTAATKSTMKRKS